MPNIQNSLAAQRHILMLCSAAMHALSCHPRGVHKMVKPGFDGTEAETWEKPIFIEAICEHSLPVEEPELALSVRPDADTIERECSVLRVSSGSHVVLEVVWTRGWLVRPNRTRCLGSKLRQVDHTLVAV